MRFENTSAAQRGTIFLENDMWIIVAFAVAVGADFATAFATNSPVPLIILVVALAIICGFMKLVDWI
jgi:hypothetical protein